MKILSALAGITLMIATAGSANAQRLKLTEGSLDAIRSETSLNFDFTYDNMGVGKFEKESDYVAKKTEEYNKKEAGRGDNWAKAWVDDRKDKFEPKFIQLFTE